MDSPGLSVPFIDITRYEPGFLEELLPRVETLIRKAHFVGGPIVKECENSLKRITQAQHVVACANGTDALQVALRAAGVQNGDLVLLPDMTFWATFEAIVNVGAQPVTVDVDQNTLHLSKELLLQAIDRFHPKAVLLVHLYGWAVPEILEMRTLCRERDVLLIEDCAQSLGVEIGGQSLIAGAHLATTSFYPAKVLGASGDAGAIFTSDAELAKKAVSLADHGRSDHYAHGSVGWNSRLGAFEATFLIQSAHHLPQRIASRRRVLEIYRQELGPQSSRALPLKILGPGAQIFENGYTSVAWLEPKLRNDLLRHLEAHKIGCRVIYPGAMSEQPGARGLLAGKYGEGVAARISQSVLSLPVFAYMRDEEIERVIEVVKDFRP